MKAAAAVATTAAVVAADITVTVATVTESTGTTTEVIAAATEKTAIITTAVAAAADIARNKRLRNASGRAVSDKDTPIRKQEPRFPDFLPLVS